ncbi:MFS transporter [Kitasatospora sp. NPDC127111]|uniref:MFS transporter n=1 Tax=Kitasatospora sp. NPDC127111 TaxID=3345363 RepID=UPI00362A6369
MAAPGTETGTNSALRPGAAALAALAGAQFTVVLSTSIVNVALPAVRDGIGLSESGMSWVVNAYGLAFGALLLPGGRVADLLGRRRVLLAGLALFAAAALTAGLATTPWLLVTARALQGLGAAAVAPAALALVMQLHPAGPGRGRALGVWGAVSGAGGAAGVLLGGVLTERLGWPWVFHASAAGAVLVLVGTVLLVPGGAPTAAGGRLDLGGTVTAALGLTALTYGLTAGGHGGWTAPGPLTAFALAAVLLPAFVLLERRHPDPLLPRRVLAAGPVAPANLVMALLGSVWVGLFYFLPLYQQQVLGAGPLAAGLGQLPLAAATTAGSSLAPRIAARIGPTATLAAGLLTLAGGLLWLAAIRSDGTYPADLLGPLLLVGFGLGPAFVQLTSAAVTGVAAADSGLAGGLVNTSRQLGGAVGLAVLGSLAASATAGSAAHHARAAALTEGYRTAFLASALVLAAATALTPYLARRTPAAAPAVPAPAPR